VGAVGVWPPFPVIDLDRMPGAGSPDLAMEEIPETLGFGIPGVGSCDMLVAVCGLGSREGSTRVLFEMFRNGVMRAITLDLG
jgi:hypothetical protein